MKKILSVPFKIKEVGEDGIFSGYGSVFGNIDQGRDMVVKGAFDNSLAKHLMKETMPMMFYSHSMQKECGEWLEMSPDDYGLFCRGQLWIDGPTPDPDALKAYRGMKKQKSKMGLSIGYGIPEGGAEYVKDGGYWKLKELDLYEISPTPFPMNDLARVQDVKGLKTERDLERFLRDSGISRVAACGILAKARSIYGQRESDTKELENILNRNISFLE